MKGKLNKTVQLVLFSLPYSDICIRRCIKFQDWRLPLIFLKLLYNETVQRNMTCERLLNMRDKDAER